METATETGVMVGGLDVNDLRDMGPGAHVETHGCLRWTRAEAAPVIGSLWFADSAWLDGMTDEDLATLAPRPFRPAPDPGQLDLFTGAGA